MDGRRNGPAEAVCLPLEEGLDIREVLPLEGGHVFLCRRACVSGDRKDAHPQRLLPARGERAVEPGGDGDDEQNEQQNQDANLFPHGTAVTAEAAWPTTGPV